MRKARSQALAGEEKEDDGQIDSEDKFQLEYEVLQEYDNAQKRILRRPVCTKDYVMSTYSSESQTFCKCPMCRKRTN